MLQTHLQHFFTMGGYAYFVWPAYSVAAIVLIGNLFWTRSSGKHLKRRLSRKLRKAT